MSEHETYMRRAIELAKKGAGRVSPNPMVGAVVVKNGKIIAEGYHKRFGAPHAEVEALNSVPDEELKGATIYVNLEPCSHHGKTPPCADLIIEKGLAKVVAGVLDPNPEVSGKGVEKLRKAGIEVVVGVLEEECLELNKFFFKHITTGLPYTTLKIAQSIDGNIALKNGVSQWITSEQSRAETHRLRAAHDAVLIGKNTAIRDNPQLTVRLADGRDPLKILFDTYLTAPFDLTVYKSSVRTKTIVCCSEEAAKTRKAENLRIVGVNVLPVKIDDNDKINVEDALKKLYSKFNVGSILAEGGAEIFSSFVQSGLADEIIFFVAPKILGDGVSPFSSVSLASLEKAFVYKIKSVEKIGDDLKIVLVKSADE